MHIWKRGERESVVKETKDIEDLRDDDWNLIDTYKMQIKTIMHYFYIQQPNSKYNHTKYYKGCATIEINELQIKYRL